MRWLADLGLALMAALANAQPSVVTVRARTVSTRLTAYSRVDPIVIVAARAAEARVVTGLDVLPGEMVKAGAAYGHPAGSWIEALAAQRDAAVERARAALTVAKKTLHTAHQKLAQHLSTQEVIAQGQAAVAKARANLESVQSQKRALRALTSVKGKHTSIPIERGMNGVINDGYSLTSGTCNNISASSSSASSNRQVSESPYFCSLRPVLSSVAE